MNKDARIDYQLTRNSLQKRMICDKKTVVYCNNHTPITAFSASPIPLLAPPTPPGRLIASPIALRIFVNFSGPDLRAP